VSRTGDEEERRRPGRGGEGNGGANRSTSAFIKRHGIECEWTERSTYDVHLTPEFAAHSASALAAYAAAGGVSPAVHLSAEEARRETRVECVGATRWPAATVNPAQLTLGVLALCEEDTRFQAYTHAPVTRVLGTEGAWEVAGPRGTVRARKVVWATNAYGFPGVEGVVQPQGGESSPAWGGERRGPLTAAQAHKLARAPAPAFPALEGSYSLRQSTDVFYSV
jgi:glycine/D-amino acid oxidase-like deaminating enzyme